MEQKGRQWTFAFTVKWRRFLRPLLVDKHDDVWQALWRSTLAEFFGTLIFTFIGCAVVTSAQRFNGGLVNVSSLILIALAHGFGLCFVIYAIGEISGGHVNPAVSWATLITGRLSVLRFFLYFIAQISGAMVGAAINKSLLPPGGRFDLGCHELNPYMSEARGFGAEVVFTFIFIFVVFATAISPFVQKYAPLSGGGNDYGPGKLTPLALGLTILCLELVGVPLTGGSMNPARSFGPAVALHADRCWNHHWVYWAGPALGATVAATIATAIFLGNPNSVKTVLLISRGREKFNTLLFPDENIDYEARVIGDSSTTISEIKAAPYDGKPVLAPEKM